MVKWRCSGYLIEKYILSSSAAAVMMHLFRLKIIEYPKNTLIYTTLFVALPWQICYDERDFKGIFTL
jgi:hypothetical protein